MAFAEYPCKTLMIIDFREFPELEKIQATEKQPGGKLWQEACRVVTFDRSKERTFHVEHWESARSITAHVPRGNSPRPGIGPMPVYVRLGKRNGFKRQAQNTLF